MKKNLVTLTLALICASFLSTTVCMAKTVVKEKRETGTFRKISTGGGIDVYFTQAGSYSVVVEADEEYISKIVTEVEDDRLVVKWKERMHFRGIFNNRIIKVHVSAPALTKVSSSGGADFYADDLKCEESFQLSVSGGADAHIKNLTVSGDVNIASSGGADVDIKNLTVAGDSNIASSGGADCDIENLQTRNCNLSSSGGSDVNVNVSASGNLNASSSGGADINISGEANDVKVSASGGADVDIRRLKYANIDISKSGGGDVDR
jgi:hypothetical protein